MNFDKTITIKVSIKQFDTITNYAKERGSDVSNEIRRVIDKIGRDPQQIQEDIDYYQYRIKSLKDEKAKKENEISVKEKKQEMKATVEKSKQEGEEELKKWKRPIIKEMIKKFGSVLEFKDKKQRDKATKDVKEFVNSVVEGLSDDIKIIYYNSLFIDACKYILNYSEEDIKRLTNGKTK